MAHERGAEAVAGPSIARLNRLVHVLTPQCCCRRRCQSPPSQLPHHRHHRHHHHPHQHNASGVLCVTHGTRPNGAFILVLALPSNGLLLRLRGDWGEGGSFDPGDYLFEWLQDDDATKRLACMALSPDLSSLLCVTLDARVYEIQIKSMLSASTPVVQNADEEEEDDEVNDPQEKSTPVPAMAADATNRRPSLAEYASDKR